MPTINPRTKLVDLPDELSKLVIEISDEYTREDANEREQHRPLWLKLENYFNGLQRLYWSMVAKDWRFIDDEEGKPSTTRHYDKIVNIYRAHGESIIAALSVKTPSVIFYPEDADVEEDIVTAKVCSKIKEQIERHNVSQLLMIKSLLILWNTGTVAAYIYNRKHSKYGTYSTPQYDEKPDNIHTVLLNCKECGSNIDEKVFHSGEKESIPDESRECPSCGYKGVPEKEEYDEEIPKIIGSIVNPKSRTIIEVFSPLFVHIPFYAREQEHIPYLRLKFEQHFSLVKNIYPKLAKKGIKPSVDRDDVEYRGLNVNVNDSNLCTVECLWVRNWGYDIIEDRDKEVKRLRDKYPDGIYAVIIDGNLVEIKNEALDDHWEISNSPLSTYIHGEPLGKPLAPIQEINNEVVDLQIETLEHSIPETFARADVLDFKKYGNSKAAPGMVFPIKAPMDGSPLAGAFHSLKTATLSEETEVFAKRLDEKGQFVSASFPSIYGGPATSGSKTAKEYTESRSMALQRLSIPWNTVKFFWAGLMGKAVPLFIRALKETQEDYKSVDKTNTGFVNNWITQEDIAGRIGRVEADVDEDMPQSAAQLKDIFIQLMTLKDEHISEALYHPENTPLLIKALGAPEFYIPGSDERNKQYDEFRALLRGEHVEITEIDNNVIEAEVCDVFLTSSTGQMIKRNNPEGWDAIRQHRNDHLAAEVMKNQAKSQVVPPNPEQTASPETVNSAMPGVPNV
jgi:hypothetical protein